MDSLYGFPIPLNLPFWIGMALIGCAVAVWISLQFFNSRKVK